MWNSKHLGIDQEVWGNGSIYYMANVLMKKEGEVLASQEQSAMHPGEMKTSASLNIYDSSLTKSPNTL